MDNEVGVGDAEMLAESKIAEGGETIFSGRRGKVWQQRKKTPLSSQLVTTNNAALSAEAAKGFTPREWGRWPPTI